jgi:hypothetical protein
MIKLIIEKFIFKKSNKKMHLPKKDSNSTLPNDIRRRCHWATTRLLSKWIRSYLYITKITKLKFIEWYGKSI